MSAKNYKNYIELLKSREARPSFERTKAILASVEYETSANFAAVSKTRNWVIGISALVFLALIARMVVYDSLKINHAATKGSPGSQGVTQSEHSTSRTSLRGVLEGRRSNPLRANATSRDCFVTPPGFLAMTGDLGSGLAKSSKDISASEESSSAPFVGLVASVPPRCIIIEFEADHDIPITLSQIALPATDEQSSNNFFLTLSGNLSQELNSSAAYSNFSFTDAFVGGGYIISPRLSIGLVGGRETFVRKQPNYSTSFTNEQFEHDGVVYPSIIGHIDTSFTPRTTQVYSIGANLRYTYSENSFSPYAEIFGGGSTEGAIARVTVGASIFRFDQFSIDAGAFICALIPPTGSALTRLGASIQLRYDW